MTAGAFKAASMTIGDSSPALASVRSEECRAFIGGTYWWNHTTIQSLFSSSAGPPVFCRSIDEAISDASREGGRVIAWAARLTPGQEAACAEQNIDLVRIEDGFIRSIGLGAGFAGAASLAVDARGIYYDAARPSDLEHMLQTTVLSDSDRAEGALIRRRIVELRLSKYNLRSRHRVQLNSGGRRVVFVPGQVADDASVLNSMVQSVDPRSGTNINLQLLHQARTRNPNAFLIYKPHPDVRHGLRNGRVATDDARAFANLVVEDVDVLDLIEACDAVETITSLVGFEALLRGKHVTAHGLPFYAGWGATEDLVCSPRRSARRSADELCYIAFVRYTRHVHPFTGQPCSVHELLDALDAQRSSLIHQIRVAILRRFAQFCESVSNK